MTDRIPLYIDGRRIWTEAPENLSPQKVADIISRLPKGCVMHEGRSRLQRRIKRGVRQAEKASLKNLALLHLERFRAKVQAMPISDYVDAVTERRNAGQETEARLLQMARFPPDETPPAA